MIQNSTLIQNVNRGLVVQDNYFGYRDWEAKWIMTCISRAGMLRYLLP